MLVAAVDGCSLGGPRVAGRRAPPDALELAPLRARTDRITQITVCTRPFRAQGPRLEVEQIGRKTIVHNYGHGGSGWSLSWGSSGIAVEKAIATGERDIAVIGCGALGLTSALLLQRAGARATIYAKDLPPNVRSSLATGLWTPDSRICLEDNATPAFKQLWANMARRSFQTYQSLLTVPGIGPIVASALLSEIGDFARFDSPAEYCSFIGLLPWEHSSGEKTYSKGMQPRCNKHLRPLLIEASWVAIRKEPLLLKYYRRHAVRNNKHAIIKVARKLALIAKGVAQKLQDYQSSYHQQMVKIKMVR